MKNGMTTDAKDEYKARRIETKRLMGQINQKIKRHENEANAAKGINWGHVGDLGHVIELLVNINDFLGK